MEPTTTRAVKANQNLKVTLRNLTMNDYADLNEIMNLSYSGIGGQSWRKGTIERLLTDFPEGQLCIEVNGKAVAIGLAIMVDYDKYGDKHTYRQITNNYKLDTHDPDGDVLYGIDIAVHPEYRDLRLGRRLYDARKELCESLNLRAIIAGGRIPGYSKVADDFSPKQYIQKVQQRELYDPILTFQLANDFHVVRVLKNYLDYDTESRGFATLLEWVNVYYEENERLFNRRKSVVRLGVVQWQMRPHDTLESLEEQLEFFIDAVAAYKADFVLFPEFFNAPLMAKYNELGEAEAIRKLADYTEPLRQRCQQFAVAYNVNIITGSMPYIDDDGKLYNISYLCRRDGSSDSYRKIHITPSEASAWGMVGGSKLQAFDTDCGKIGILVCYDVEFPELCRLYADQGVSILFVPFMTDTKTGFHRVSRCAMARAIENECYVAIAGSVGNLPRVHNMDIQYAESAVYSPSDFAFANDAVVAQATPNAELMLIADVDLDLLKDLHLAGSVRNLRDRRKDLFSITWKGKK
jgi:predicted amidohydrolase/ribosomal protein S18 acetylase RimI-like enzyme